MANATTIPNVLNSYCASSGQLVSDPKSSIFSAQIRRQEIRRKYVQR
jgi:hypothetical protein